ncbi:MAG TPA: mobilization protein [Ktedonobacteraceae bacterium]|jgi:hypothetical protein|nr:mobilization protein [Ktedonobacteraceae bacterium]
MSSDKLARLREKRKVIAEQIRREENRLSRQERKKDTRRKILVGAAILHKAENEPEYKKWLIHLLDGFLEREDDRALFGLPPAKLETEKPAES